MENRWILKALLPIAAVIGFILGIAFQSYASKKVVRTKLDIPYEIQQWEAVVSGFEGDLDRGDLNTDFAWLVVRLARDGYRLGHVDGMVGCLEKHFKSTPEPRQQKDNRPLTMGCIVQERRRS